MTVVAIDTDDKKRKKVLFYAACRVCRFFFMFKLPLPFINKYVIHDASRRSELMSDHFFFTKRSERKIVINLL